VTSFHFRGTWDPVVNYDTTKKDIVGSLLKSSLFFTFCLLQTHLLNYLKSQFKPTLMQKLLMGHSAIVPTYYLAQSSENPKIGMAAVLGKNLTNNFEWAAVNLICKY